MLLSTQILVLAALALDGALAQPAHRHQHKHQRSLEDVLKRGVDYADVFDAAQWSSVCAGGKCGAGAPAPAAATPAPVVNEKIADTAPAQTTSSSPPPASSSAPAKSSSGSTGGSAQCINPNAFKTSDNSLPGVQGPIASQAGQDWTDASVSAGSSKEKRATAAQVNYAGNIGTPYGRNIIPLSSCDKLSDYFYTATFINNMGSTQTFWLWNKISPDGKIGMTLPAFFTFTLGPGESAAYAFEEGSIIGFSQACGRASGNGGVPNCNVGEANFGGSGYYDVSMVTVSAIKAQGGNPVTVPMSISVPGYSASTTTTCNFQNPDENTCSTNGDSSGCNCGDGQKGDSFHMTVVYG